MTIVSGVFVPGTSTTGVAMSNTSIQCLSLDLTPLSANNSNSSPNVGGAANACYFPLNWAKPETLPLVDLSRVFILAGNNTDGVAYLYTTQP